MWFIGVSLLLRMEWAVSSLIFCSGFISARLRSLGLFPTASYCTPPAIFAAVVVIGRAGRGAACSGAESADRHLSSAGVGALGDGSKWAERVSYLTHLLSSLANSHL